MSVINQILKKANLFSRFSLAGIVNTIFHYSIICLSLYLGFTSSFALFIAFITALFFNNFTYSLAFKSTNNNHVKYFLNQLFIYLFAMFFLLLFSKIILNDYLLTFLATISAAIINFIILDKFIFTR